MCVRADLLEVIHRAIAQAGHDVVVVHHRSHIRPAFFRRDKIQNHRRAERVAVQIQVRPL